MSQSNRYSIEVNFQTDAQKIREDFSKLCLGFVSAALKAKNFQVKKVFEKDPIRIIVSAHNWTDGMWCLVISHHKEEDCFVISKGFYNKDRETITKQSSEKCIGHSASEIFKQVYAKMNSIKDEKPHHIHLNGVKGKTGPTQGKTRPTQKYKVSDDILPKIQDKLGT